MPWVLETLALRGKAESNSEFLFERNGIRDEVHQRYMQRIFSDALQIKARDVTCPVEKLLIYQWMDTGVGPGRRFMMMKEDVKLVGETGGR